MELILNEEDMKKVLEEHYSGVKGVSFIVKEKEKEKRIEARIEIEADFLRRKSYSITNTKIEDNRKPLTLEEKNKEEAKKGTMTSGGKVRAIRSMG